MTRLIASRLYGKRARAIFASTACMLLMLGVPVKGIADDAKDAKIIVDEAQTTLKNFLNDPDMKWFGNHLKNANGVYIVPRLIKGALVVGLEGGNGVFLKHDEKTGTWSEPVFFETTAASFGLQAGGQTQEAIMLVMSPSGVESLLTSNVKLGADGSVAIGPKGMGTEGATAPNMNVDFLTFSRAKGLYAGVSFDGAVVRTRDELNAAYYGKKVRPTDIVIANTVTPNPNSKDLKQMLAMDAPQ